MGLIILLVVLILLFGGGGFYYGPSYPYYGGGLGFVLLILVLVLVFRAGPDSRVFASAGQNPTTGCRPAVQVFLGARELGIRFAAALPGAIPAMNRASGCAELVGRVVSQGMV
jgi:hypothetical protein